MSTRACQCRTFWNSVLICVKIAVQGADEAVFVLAPVLLLLNQDPLLFRGLTAQRRYFPPLCAASLFLTVNAAAAIFSKWSARGRRSPFVDAERVGPLYVLGSLALLVMTLPNHVNLLRVRATFLNACTRMQSLPPAGCCQELVRKASGMHAPAPQLHHAVKELLMVA